MQAFTKKHLSHLVKLITVYVIGCILLPGCSSLSIEQPDLQKLYALQKGNLEQPPVVLIHGITGARIHDSKSNTELWPGSLSNLLFSNYH